VTRKDKALPQGHSAFDQVISDLALGSPESLEDMCGADLVLRFLASGHQTQVFLKVTYVLVLIYVKSYAQCQSTDGRSGTWL
jgi:hypothetical protein